MPKSPDSSLADSALTALAWSYTGRIVQTAAQFTIGVVLARMLGPEPFGLIAMAWLLIGLANQVADLGLSAALVQRASVSRDEIRYAFTMQCLIGIVLTLAVGGSAGFLALTFRSPALTPVARWLSLTFFIQSFGQTATSLLKRDLDFKSLQVAQVASYLGAYFVIGIPIAAAGGGVWSLVAAQLTQSLLYTCIVCLRRPYSLAPLVRPRPAGLLGFGSKVTGVNLLNWAILSLDTAVLARFFGVTVLGLYNRSFNLLSGPANNALSTLQSVLFPAYSKRQENAPSLKRVYLTSFAAVATVILPCCVIVAVLHRTTIVGLYGERWLEAAPLLVPLSLAMSLHALMGLSGPLLWARGRVEIELRVSAMVAILYIPVLVLASRVSFYAVAWGVLLVYAIRFVMITGKVLDQIGGSWVELVRAGRGAFALAAGLGLLSWRADLGLAVLTIAPHWRLGLEAMLAGGATLLTVLAFPRLVFGAESIWLLSRFAVRYPRLAGLLARRLDLPDPAEMAAS